MAQYRRKATAIQAVQVSDVLAAQATPQGLAPVAPWLQAAYNAGRVFFGNQMVGVTVPGLGPKMAQPTDWLMLDEAGNLAVLDDGSFQNSYEAI